MSGYDVLKIVSTVVLSLGGGGMIVFLLSGWLGRVWANRLMEEDRAKHARALEALKTEFEAVNKKVQAELDKTVFVHRVQFETEFKALSEIWASVVDVRGTMIGLRPVFDVVSKDDDELKRLKERFAPFVKALSELKHVTYVNSPFYPIEIHKELLGIIKPATLEEMELRTSRPENIQGQDWFDHGEKHFAEVRSGADRLSELIRARIQTLALYRE